MTTIANMWTVIAALSQSPLIQFLAALTLLLGAARLASSTRRSRRIR